MNKQLCEEEGAQENQQAEQVECITGRGTGQWSLQTFF